MGIKHIIIVENKDTYQAIPTTEHAICIFGSGHAATRIKTLLPWITTTPHIIYWGDIDADGLEILSELRQTGIACDSILMDSTAYKTYEPYGTKLDTKNNPSKHTTPNQHQDSHNTKETYTNNSAPGKTQPTYESNKNASPSTTQ